MKSSIPWGFPAILAALLSPVGAAASDIALRVSSLRAVNERILPEVFKKSGAEHLVIPDLELSHTQGAGYDVRVSLRSNRIALPLGACGPDCVDTLQASFAPGRELRLQLEFPGARGEGTLVVDLVSPHWYEPNLHEEYQIRVQGARSLGRLAFEVSGGRIVPRALDVSDTQVIRATVENPGALGRILDFLLAHGNFCNGQCHTLDEFLTFVANTQLRGFLSSDAFAAPLIVRLQTLFEQLADLRFPVRDLGIAMEAHLDDVLSDGALTLLSSSVRLTLLGAADSCAEALAPPAEQPVAGTGPWDASAPRASYEVAIAGSKILEIAYLLGKQGIFCATGTGKVFGRPYDTRVRPVGSPALTPFAAGSAAAGYELRIPIAIDFRGQAGGVRWLSSRKIRAEVAVRYEIKSDPAAGLHLEFVGTQLGSVTGKLVAFGIPISIRRFEERIRAMLESNIRSRAAVIPLLGRRVPLSDELTLELAPWVQTNQGFLMGGLELE